MLDPASPFALAAPPGAEPRMDVAARRLRQAIIACELAPGSFVHEAMLAERFSLGRAAVRVALTSLAEAGFVTRHARQGWRIAPVDGRLVGAMLDARRRLEPSLAKRRLGDAEASALRQLSSLVRSAAGRTEPAALATTRATDRQIRNLIAADAGVIGRRWFADIWDHADRTLRMLDIAGHPVAAADWRLLIEALAGQHESAATAAIHNEIERFATAVALGLLAVDSGPSRPAPRSARRRSIRPPAKPVQIRLNSSIKE